MPFEQGTYFTAADERQTKFFLTNQGLTQRQVTEIRAWHRSRLSAQMSLWSLVAALVGITLGFLLAQLF